MNYQEFLERKRHKNIEFGITPTVMPDAMFDFQKHITERAIKKGRCAIFLDTGLGKTIIELVIAENYAKQTNKPVLIITPLAVAFQFLKEAEKFGIDGVEYSKDGTYTKKIIICNYERLHYFSPSDFECVILDESSILKNFSGAIKTQVTAFLRKVNYRYLATATPSPNDYIELGTSSEALGYMGFTDMLTMFFKQNNNAVDAKRAGQKMYIKPHAEKDFWRWVASWSISARKPSDLGFSDELHVLPELVENQITITNKNPLVINGQGSLFALPAVNFHEIKQEARVTINDRCEMAVERASDHETTVYWCNLNNEADRLLELDRSSVEVRGNMSIDKKEEILIGFSTGQVKKLVTKTSITAFGLNWQHCNHTTYFPTYSYEQYYQAVRRFWRFGQKRNVYIDLILSDGQDKIMESLFIKKTQAIKMFDELTQQTTEVFKEKPRKEFNKSINLPKFITQ